MQCIIINDISSAPPTNRPRAHYVVSSVSVSRTQFKLKCLQLALERWCQTQLSKFYWYSVPGLASSIREGSLPELASQWSRRGLTFEVHVYSAVYAVVRCLSARLSVCLSVTHVYFVETTKLIIKQLA